MKKISIGFPLLYFLFIIFTMVFFFDSSMITSESESTYNNICVPYFDSNITISLFIISVIVFLVLMLIRKKIYYDNIGLLLLIRIPLYFIPLLYIHGEFKIGVAYAIVQCLFSFFIGFQENKKEDFSKFLVISFLVTIVIGFQIFYTMFYYKISFFSDSLKWYMVIPLGRSNYISCILLPIYVMINFYLVEKNKILLSLIYSIYIFLCVLGTGSKWGILLFIIFCVITNIKYFKKIILRKNGVYLFVLIALILFIPFVFNDCVSFIEEIIDKFTSNNIFYNRIQVYKGAIDLIFDNFLFGRSAYYYFIYDASKAHNFILESLIQTGFIGTIIYIIIFVIAIRKVVSIENRIQRNCFLLFIISYLIQGLAEPNLFGATSDAFFWFIVGFAVSFCYNRKENISRRIGL